MKTSSDLAGPHPTDIRLVQGYLAGNDHDFSEIVRRYHGMVFKLALKITGNHQDAEDAAQDAFLNLATKLARFEGRSSLKTWIYRVAVNAALMVVRGVRKHQHVELNATGGDFDEDGTFAHVVPDWSTQPDRVLLSDEAQDVIRRGIEKLPEKFKTVLILADVEQLANQEICQVLDLSLPAVKSRLHRARLFLRSELAVYFERRGKRERPILPARRPALGGVC